MGGCYVRGCSNHSRNKDRMLKIPADPNRRKIWITFTGLREEDVPKSASICEVHFDEEQFEKNRVDGWKKLKPNAIPTLFPAAKDVAFKPNMKRRSQPRKRKAESDEPATVSPKSKKAKKLAKSSKAAKRDKDSDKKSGKGKSLLVKISGGVIANSQKENVLPGNSRRKSPRPCKITHPLVESDTSSSSEEEDDDDDELDEVVEEYKGLSAEQHVKKLKLEIESLKKEISEFEMHNKSMVHAISELEKHNKLMSIKIIELDKENKVLTFKVKDLEKLNDDLKEKLNCSFTEEQLARMNKMKALGKIERYIPALQK